MCMPSTEETELRVAAMYGRAAFAAKAQTALAVLRGLHAELKPHATPDNVPASAICARIENAIGEIKAQQTFGGLAG